MGTRHRNFLITLFLAGGFVITSASAQQATSDTTVAAPHQTKQNVDTDTVEKPAPYDITGIVAQAFKIRKPLQMVSPLAPAKDGDGHDNVSWDPDKPDKPKGIILFGIQW